ncbi:MAG: SPOR domain-containing protein, partial [Propionivibrio sp.]
MRILVSLLVVANLVFAAWAQGLFGTPVNPDALRVSRQLQPERLTIVARDQPPPLPVKPEPPAVKPVPPVAKPEPVAVKPEPLPVTPEPAVVEAKPAAVEPEPVPVEPEASAPASSAGNSAENGTDIGGGNEVSNTLAAPPVCLLLADLPPADAETFEAVLADRFAAFKVQRTVTTAAGSYWINIPPLPSKQEADAKVAELKKLGVVEYFIVQQSGPNNLAISLGLYSRRPAAEAHFE